MKSKFFYFIMIYILHISEKIANIAIDNTKWYLFW